MLRLSHIFLCFTATATVLTIGLGAGWATGARARDVKPAYFSLKRETVNMRAGPGRRYPVRWVFKRRGLPVRLRRAIGAWRLIVDRRGTQGWVHVALLSKVRTVEIVARSKTGTRPLRAEAKGNSKVVAYVQTGVIARLLACRLAWCRVRASDRRGWIEKKHLWGVGAREVFE
jgi:SH3-like domain-containing protein